MQNSQLIHTLKTFSDKELRDFRKWLQSPAHNQREDVTRLFGYLTVNSRLTKEKYLGKEKVFSKVFPKEKYDDAKIRQSMHFLLKTMEEFLIYCELLTNQVRSQTALASVFRKRKLDTAFQKTIRRVETQLKKSSHKNETFLRDEYLLEQEKYTFLEGKKRSVEMNLQEVSDALDNTFVADKLRQSCLMLAHEKVYKTKYEIGLLKEVLEYVESQNLMYVPAIAIYYYIFKSNTEKENPAHFEELKQQINENGDLFPHHEIRDIYLMGINYCIRKINEKGSFKRDAFELFRSGFEKKILIYNNTISKYSFINVISIGLSLGEFDWVENFIAHFSSYLQKPARESIVHFSYAKLRYEKRDFKEAMRLLIQADYDDILLTLVAKTMLMKMYYELNELDALESLLESMRTYMQRKKIIGYHKMLYGKTIKYTKKLLKVNPYDKGKKEKLEQEIASGDSFPEREWILEQIKQL